MAEEKDPVTKMAEGFVRTQMRKSPDKKEQIEWLLQVIREELEKDGSYYEFAQTIPWNLEDRRSMAVKVTKLHIYNERPVQELPPMEESDVDQG